MTDTILMTTALRTTRSELVVCLPVLLYHHIIFLYYIDFLIHCGFPCTGCTQRRSSAVHRVSSVYYNIFKVLPQHTHIIFEKIMCIYPHVMPVTCYKQAGTSATKDCER